MHACTIAARNYLAQVRVLADSFTAVHPASPFTVLVVDGEPGELYDSDAPYRALSPTEVGFTADELHRMALIYDITELSTAVKPRFLEHLLAEGGEDVVVFLDPDMVVYDDLSPIEPLADTHGIVLVPHVLGPMPRDGRLIDEHAVLLAGMYNLGFVAVTRRAAPFLDWWGERTAFHCCSDTAAGMFTDQRWVDFVPALFDHAIWRDPGFNVAYWNLHERAISRRDDGRLLAGGAPLRALHFSGYDIDQPHLLSKHQGPSPRVLLSEQPVLADLTADYDDRVRAAGIERWRRVPYRFASIAGTPVPLAVRRLARAALLDDTLPSPPLPFGADGDDGFVRWLNHPIARNGDDVVSRLALSVWHQRVDLQVAFPQPTGADLGAFTSWAALEPTFRASHGQLYDPPLLPLPAPGRDAPLPGLNIVGYLHAELGVGEAGRLMALAADAAGVPHQTIPYGDTLSRQLDPFTGHRRAVEPPDAYAVNLLCVNADRTPHVLAELPVELLAGRHRIGLWFWEVERASCEIEAALDLVDEVWVTSDYVAGPVRGAGTGTPVLVAPLAIPPPVTTRLRRDDVGLPADRRVFLSCFDALSVPARKNPEGAIIAYRRAFSPDDGAHLLVKAINGDRHPVVMEKLWHLAGDRPDIEIRDGYVSRSEVSALVQLSDAYLSLHRAEGFGLLPAAAMAAGKPVIATGYSGNLAFMRSDTSLLVPYELVEVGPGNEPYPADVRWAEPDLDAAAAHLRWVIADPEGARALGAHAREDVARTHGPEVAGAWIAARLRQILRGEPARPTPDHRSLLEPASTR